jgi:hypothetical protein
MVAAAADVVAVAVVAVAVPFAVVAVAVPFAVVAGAVHFAVVAGAVPSAVVAGAVPFAVVLGAFVVSVDVSAVLVVLVVLASAVVVAVPQMIRKKDAAADATMSQTVKANRGAVGEAVAKTMTVMIAAVVGGRAGRGGLMVARRGAMVAAARRGPRFVLVREEAVRVD